MGHCDVWLKSTLRYRCVNLKEKLLLSAVSHMCKARAQECLMGSVACASMCLWEFVTCYCYEVSPLL